MATAPVYDEELRQLHLLGLFHFIAAGLIGLFSLFPLIHVAIGIAAINGSLDATNPPPPLFGWMFLLIGSFLVLCGLVTAGLVAYAGRCLRARRRHTLCLVIAGVECMFMPFGTVLGVFTLILLTRPSVRGAFA
ncbi:hypothetical protein [Cognatilysobacter terrigena]|uniref:hypothetical protein n=1 Tax=Cognatilysobacter terrigena TaxID=2488749 RepID=UPI00105F7FCD|nr:hypothetical protein [Lysobacter terrigena]